MIDEAALPQLAHDANGFLQHLASGWRTLTNSVPADRWCIAKLTSHCFDHEVGASSRCAHGLGRQPERRCREQENRSTASIHLPMLEDRFGGAHLVVVPASCSGRSALFARLAAALCSLILPRSPPRCTTSTTGGSSASPLGDRRCVWSGHHPMRHRANPKAAAWRRQRASRRNNRPLLCSASAAFLPAGALGQRSSPTSGPGRRC